ncbi:MAG: ComEC/Rec2 family competence protein [Candidatus Limisoma sp.]
MLRSLNRHPFVGIAVCFALGIVMANHGAGLIAAAVLAAIGTGLCLVPRFASAPLRRYRLTALYRPGYALLFVAAGIGCFVANRPNTVDLKHFDRSTVYTFVARTVTHGNATTTVDADATIDGCRHRLIVNLQGSDYQIHTGDSIVGYGRLQPIAPPTLPYCFDQAKYLKNKGILYRLYVKRNRYTIVGRQSGIRPTADDFRRATVDAVYRTRFDDKTANFLITILTGDKFYIDDDMRLAFSRAGIAHVLAVSGLHIAILSMLVAWILGALDRLKLRRLRLVLTLAAVWWFTFATGLSPSAVRAAVMSSFMIVSILALRKHSIVNALFAAAFFTLLVNPTSLFDAGFQLSYASVIGIIMFANAFRPNDTKTLKARIIGLIATSLAAQLGTAILTIYYFHTFPLAFLVANVVVVPLLPIFITLGTLTTLIAAVGLRISILVKATDMLYAAFDRLSQALADVGDLTVSGLYIPTSAALCIGAAILCLGLWLNNRRYHRLLWVASACVVGSVVTWAIETSATPSNSEYIANGYNSTVVAIRRGNTLYLADSAADSAEIEKFLTYSQEFVNRMHITRTLQLTADTVVGNLHYRHPYIIDNRTSFVFAEGNIARRLQRPAKRIRIGTIIITKHYYGTLSDLRNYYDAERIVLANEVYDDKRNELLTEARKTGIRVVDIAAGDIP